MNVSHNISHFLGGKFEGTWNPYTIIISKYLRSCALSQIVGHILLKSRNVFKLQMSNLFDCHLYRAHENPTAFTSDVVERERRDDSFGYRIGEDDVLRGPHRGCSKQEGPRGESGARSVRYCSGTDEGVGVADVERVPGTVSVALRSYRGC